MKNEWNDNNKLSLIINNCIIIGDNIKFEFYCKTHNK